MQQLCGESTTSDKWCLVVIYCMFIDVFNYITLNCLYHLLRNIPVLLIVKVTTGDNSAQSERRVTDGGWWYCKFIDVFNFFHLDCFYHLSPNILELSIVKIPRGNNST